MKKILLFNLIIFILLFSFKAEAKYELTKFDPEQVLTKLFDKFDAPTDSSSHTLQKSIIKEFNLGMVFNEETLFKTTLLGIYEFEKDKKKKYYVVTQTTHETLDCHACGALIGIATFSKNNKDWVLEDKLQYVNVLGSWGQAPIPELVKLGKNEYGLAFYPAFMNQGINSVSFILIAKKDKKFQEVISLSPFSEDNLGGCGSSFSECYSFDSKINFTVGAGEQFAPILIKTSGTKFDKNRKAVKFEKTYKYIFEKNTYKLIKTSDL
ncbi:MAG: hypothetical protein U0457_04390 [Candidatus Sericytochromatia bacterium]